MSDALSKLYKPEGATTRKTRRGRGVGSGLGKTAGRGQKGQFARTRGFKPHFEGGQTPLQRRLPKRGFNARVRGPSMVQLNVSVLQTFEVGANVDERSLRERGLIRGGVSHLKILGSGEISKAVTVTAHAFSKSAVAKIEAAGGRVRLISAIGQQ